MTPVNRMRPIHPGEILQKDFMDPLGIKPAGLAEALKLPLDQVVALLEGRGRVTLALAKRLSADLGTTFEFWLNLQARYDQSVAASARDCAGVPATPGLKVTYTNPYYVVRVGERYFSASAALPLQASQRVATRMSRASAHRLAASFGGRKNSVRIVKLVPKR